jgi:hypothetical protein
MAPIPGLLLGAAKAGNAGAVFGAAGGASVSKVGIGDLHLDSLWLALRLGVGEQERKANRIKRVIRKRHLLLNSSQGAIGD